LRDDKWRISKDKRHNKQALAGWELENERVDSNTSWLPLRELKETYMVETAEHSKANSIIEEPAFDWWAQLILKKVPLRMLFDLKLNFTPKARLVVGGHMKNTPTKLTYSSVLSRDSLILIAALYEEQQNTIECSTFGSEFVALQIASELNDAL